MHFPPTPLSGRQSLTRHALPPRHALLVCLKSRTYVSALTLSALHYPYSTLTYRRSALISTVHCQNSRCAPTGNEFAVWRFFFGVFFFFCRFPPGGKRPIYLWNILIYINLHIQYYFTFVERVGLNCYSCVLRFWSRPCYVDKTVWKAIGPHSNFRRFDAPPRFPLRFGALLFSQSALKKVSVSRQSLTRTEVN